MVNNLTIRSTLDFKIGFVYLKKKTQLFLSEEKIHEFYLSNSGISCILLKVLLLRKINAVLKC